MDGKWGRSGGLSGDGRDRMGVRFVGFCCSVVRLLMRL